MTYTLPIEPMAAPRPRAARRGNFISIYNPSSYTKWKESAAEEMRAWAPKVPLDSPLRVTVTFYCTRPRTTILDAPKPDIDNYVKGFLDAMTDACWWTDDTRVHLITAEKRWALPGAEGFTEFTVEEINNAAP